MVHFPSFTSDDAFSITTEALFYEAEFEPQSWPVEMKSVVMGRKRGCVKKEWPHDPASPPSTASISSLQVKQHFLTAGSGASQRQPSSCLRCHSALNVRSLLRRAGHGCLPFFLPLGMLKHPQHFLLKQKSRWRMTCRHELNFCLITFDETPGGAACWLGKSLRGVFCREWSLVVIVLNVGWLLSASYPIFTFP